MDTNFQVSPKEISNELAEKVGATFVQRWDLFAIQTDDGRDFSVKAPLKTSHLVLHLKGQITLGVYSLASDSTSCWMVFDSDSANGMEKLSKLSNLLLADGIPSYLETSRRGGHLWFFFSRHYSGRKIRLFGNAIIARNSLEIMELFPKQDSL